MNLSEFDFNLPVNFIAQKQIKPRDHSRLLVLNKKTQKIIHSYFYNIIDYLNKGDILILNNSKVFPARLLGVKKYTGGKIEVFLLKKYNVKKKELWQCLIKRGKIGLKIDFLKNLQGFIEQKNQDGTWGVSFNIRGKNFINIINAIGITPLPPYIKNTVSEKKLKKDYQTIYAKNVGSVAAPTAGLHFTKRLLNKIKNKGIKIQYITLHVGLGTFAPVKTKKIEEHKIHQEWINVRKNTIKNILQAKKQGCKIIAVGTTSVRTLETVFKNFDLTLIDKYKFLIKDFSGWTDIFIYPGYKFKIVDAIITNFHLPKSSLIMLVSAFCAPNKNGIKIIKKTYQEAIKNKYRFYSFGDSMLII